MPLEESVRYFQWLSVKPSAHKKVDDEQMMRLARILFINAARPQATEFLDRHLESLSVDPICNHCFLFAAAYTSGRLDLKNRAIRLLDGIIYRDEGKGFFPETQGRRLDIPAERFLYVFDQIALFVQLGQGKIPVGASVGLGKLLAELRPDDSFFMARAENILNQPYPSPVKELVESMLREWKGEDFLGEWKERARQKLLSESLVRLRQAMLVRPSDPSDPAWNFSGQDINHAVNNNSAPEVARLWGDVLESVPLSEGAEQFFPIYVAAYATGRPEIQSKVVKLFQGVINATDERSNAVALRLSNYYSYRDQEEDYEYRRFDPRDQEFQQARAQSGIADRAGRANVLIEHIVQGGSRFENLKQAAAELISKLDIGYELIAKNLEHSAMARWDSPAKWISAEAIKTIKQPEYLERITQSFSLKQLDLVISRLREMSASAEGMYFDDSAWYSTGVPILFKYSARPEVIQVLREKLPSILPACQDCAVSLGLLFVGYSSGDQELQDISLDLMKSALLTPGVAVGDRLASFFSIVRAMWTQTPERLAAQIADFFAAAGLEYDLFRHQLESSFRTRKYTDQAKSVGQAALGRLVAKLKGEDYLQAVLENNTESDDEAQSRSKREEHRRIILNGEQILRRSLAGEKMPGREGEQFGWYVLSHVYDPEVASFLSSAVDAATRALEYWHYRPLILAGQASGNDELKAKTRTLVERRILGQDAFFNSTLGARLETPVRRYRFYFDELAAAVAGAGGDHKPENILPLAVDFLDSLELPYDLISAELEAMGNQKGKSAQKQIALELISRKKGREYAASVAQRPFPPKKSLNIIIGGGYSPTSSDPWQQSDLLNFYHDLFWTDAIVLNAGGEPGVNDPRGPSAGFASQLYIIETNRRLGIDEPYGSATVVNLQKTFDALSKGSLDELTVVYSGHGNTDGFAMWGRETISATRLNHFYDKFSTETYIKSIFLSCFAGSMVVPPGRQVPKRVGSLEKFLAYYYPSNRCSLASSSEDELGQYYDPNLDWEGSAWGRIFKRHPDLSLGSLKEVLMSDDNLKTSPVTTTDYFLKDVSAALCSETRLISESISLYGSDSSLWPALVQKDHERSALLKLDAAQLPEIAKICAVLQEDPVQLTRIDNKKFLDRHYIELSDLLWLWDKELINAEFPDLVDKGDGGKPDVEEIYSRYIRTGKETGLPSSQLHDILDLLATPNLNSETVTQIFSMSAKFVSFYNRKYREFMRIPGKAKKYEIFFSPQYLTEGYESIGINSMRRNVLASDEERRLNRKGQERMFGSKQRVSMESMLATLASLKPLRPLYDSIKSCEERPLRAPIQSSPANAGMQISSHSRPDPGS